MQKQALSEPVAPQVQLGRRVYDALTGCEGTVMAVVAYEEIAHIGGLRHLGAAQWVVFLRPPGGGREWVTTPDAVEECGER